MSPFILFLIILFLLSLFFVLKPSSRSRSHRSLPPGPSAIFFFAKHFLFKKKSLCQLEKILADLHSQYGPVFSFRTLPNPIVFIQHRLFAHRALILNGAALSDRPLVNEPMLTLSCNGHDINTAPYGPLWRLLRRNLTANMLHPCQLKLFAPARRWALQTLRASLTQEISSSNKVVTVKKLFKHTMFSLLTSLCFGVKVEESQIKEIIDIQYSLFKIFTSFNPFTVLPAITKILFHKRWEKIMGLRQRQTEIFLSLIQYRLQTSSDDHFLPYCYVDSLTSLELPEEDDGGRKLTDNEIVNLCHEFLSGATDTTLTAAEWIMAELVNNQDIQRKLADHIDAVVPLHQDLVEEEDLNKFPYLKAVVFEGLRLHPPAHFGLLHKATQDVDLDGFFVPRGANVLVNIAQLGWDETVWEGAMEFRPERFMIDSGEFDGEMVDMTGSREIRMMPFGAGRRMCPGYGMAILHVECFVANLVREFEWEAGDGDVVDMSEDAEFTTFMKNSLRARIVPRRRSMNV